MPGYFNFGMGCGISLLYSKPQRPRIERDSDPLSSSKDDSQNISVIAEASQEEIDAASGDETDETII